jgi:hypothetical protein
MMDEDRSLIEGFKRLVDLANRINPGCLGLGNR